MTVTVTYTEAREKFAALWDRATEDREVIRVTRRGHGDIAIIAADELDSLLETAHLLRSPRNAARLNEALAYVREHTPEPTTIKELRRMVGLGEKGSREKK